MIEEKAATTFTVLLVEDSVLLAQRIREQLEAIPGVTVLGPVPDEDGAVRMAFDSKPDALVLDLQLQSGTGFGVVARLGPTRPPVVVLTNYALPEYRRRALALGIEYFLDKSREYHLLPDVIDALSSARGP